MADTPQHCIVTALSRERLEELVAEYVRHGWRRRGDVAVAKSVIRDEPAYFCQSMCRDVVRAWDDWAHRDGAGNGGLTSDQHPQHHGRLTEPHPGPGY
jgi:hypothetical protein